MARKAARAICTCRFCGKEFESGRSGTTVCIDCLRRFCKLKKQAKEKGGGVDRCIVCGEYLDEKRRRRGWLTCEKHVKLFSNVERLLADREETEKRYREQQEADKKRLQEAKRKPSAQEIREMFREYMAKPLAERSLKKRKICCICGKPSGSTKDSMFCCSGCRAAFDKIVQPVRKEHQDMLRKKRQEKQCRKAASPKPEQPRRESRLNIICRVAKSKGMEYGTYMQSVLYDYARVNADIAAYMEGSGQHV